MFLMPKESTTMSQIMTALLMPINKKNKLNGQIMPYKVWSDKLSLKVSDWYKVYNAKNQNKVCVSIFYICVKFRISYILQTD